MEWTHPSWKGTDLRRANGKHRWSSESRGWGQCHPCSVLSGNMTATHQLSLQVRMFVCLVGSITTHLSLSVIFRIKVITFSDMKFYTLKGTIKLALESWEAWEVLAFWLRHTSCWAVDTDFVRPTALEGLRQTCSTIKTSTKIRISVTAEQKTKYRTDELQWL